MERRDSSMEAFLEERAQQLFLISDQERKGFIVKRDMQRMRSEIPLTPEQLEAVFDSLDVNNNGYLTIEQFLSGFGEFISSHSSESSWSSDDIMESSQRDSQDSEDPVQYLLQELESMKILNNIEILKQLCHRVSQGTSSHIQNNVELFLQQLVSDLKRNQEEQKNLEEALRIKDEEHEAHIRRLFEEMESQLNEDKRRKSRQDEHQVRAKRDSLERDLEEKEQQLQEALRRQQELAERVHSLREKEAEYKEENQRLVKAKDELEERLEAVHQEVLQLKRLTATMKKNEASEREKHMNAGYRLARRMMLEQQGLKQQLEILQDIRSTLERSDIPKESKKQRHSLDEELNSASASASGGSPWKTPFTHIDPEDYYYEEDDFIPFQKNDDNECIKQKKSSLP